MPSLHELKADGVPFLATARLDGVSRLSRSGRTSWGVLTLLFLWITAMLAGCGGSPEQAKEERQEKQKVVQEKMKQFMMEKKGQPKRTR